jgi:hypothetical protein
MKDKDLIYIGIIAYLGYLLLNKNKNNQTKVNNNKNSQPGNATNGGLNLPLNMDLPNLTPTPQNGMSTEDALNGDNIVPLVRDDIPTQIFGSYNLPTPYYGSIITNPIQTQPIIANQTSPSLGINTSVVNPVLDLVNPRDIDVIENTIVSGVSTIADVVFPIKTASGEISTVSPVMTEPVDYAAIQQVVNECGKSFSIPNNDKEGSYTNYWYDGRDYYTQTTSPLIRTIPVKISYEIFVEGCKKYKMFQLQYSTKV